MPRDSTPTPMRRMRALPPPDDGDARRQAREVELLAALLPPDDAPPPNGEKPARISDAELKQTFVGKYGDDWRYVDDWGKWFNWNRRAWKEDRTRQVQDRVLRFCQRNGSGSAKTTFAVMNLLKGDEEKVAATVDQWDSDPRLLGTPGGTVDTRWATMRAADRNDYITKMTAVEPGGDCPMWLAFLNMVTAGDMELQAYLQRVAGYCLTGSTEEHAMFFLHGSGGNGKGVFVNTLSGILGDYVATAPIATFMASKNEQHPTDLAGLQGARLVTASETDTGRRWDEAKIKLITGGDPVKARFMRQDFFTFRPQFKLLISGNNKPRLSTVDNAMRRRFHLVPFTVTIPADEIDTQLQSKLRPEWSGILKWMLAGCLMWRKEGLNPPAAVLAATNEYFDDQDTLGRWIEATLVRDANGQMERDKLFKSWTWWAEANNEFVGKPAVFYEALQKAGFEAAKVNLNEERQGVRVVRRGVRVFRGLRTKTPDDEATDDGAAQ